MFFIAPVKASRWAISSPGALCFFSIWSQLPQPIARRHKAGEKQTVRTKGAPSSHGPLSTAGPEPSRNSGH